MIPGKQPFERPVSGAQRTYQWQLLAADTKTLLHGAFLNLLASGGPIREANQDGRTQ